MDGSKVLLMAFYIEDRDRVMVKKVL
jgi:hypothetical protein